MAASGCRSERWDVGPAKACVSSSRSEEPWCLLLLRRQPGRVGSNMDRTGYYCFVHAADSLLGGQTTDKCFGAMLQ